MTKFLKCTKCGWIHFGLSRFEAQTEVMKFNTYYHKLSKEQQQSYYGGKESSIDSYEKCFRCGSSHENAVIAQDSEVPQGSTIQPLIVPEDGKNKIS